MSSKETFFSFFSENKALLKEYIDTRLELIKLQGIRALSQGFSLVMVALIVALLALFVLFFLGMTFAFWIASITGSNIIGFASASGLFALILLLVIAFRRVLFQNPMIRMFIRETMDETEDADY
jgi:hypothetical protein